MSQAFRTLALLGKANNDDVNQTINALYKFLREQNYNVLTETRLAHQLPCPAEHCMDIVELGKKCRSGNSGGWRRPYAGRSPRLGSL